jgi:transmembrane sensor
MSTGSSEYPKTNAEQLRDEAHGWLIRLTSGRVSAADAQLFRQWQARSHEHVQAFAQARQLWQLVALSQQQQADAAPNVEPAVTLAGVSVMRKAAAPARTGLSRRALLGGALAASVGLVALYPGWQLWSEQGADFVTGVGEQRTIALAAAGELQLNTRTQVRRQTFSDGGAGLELMVGEVALTVNGPLRVLAGSGELSVRQGQFNLRLLDDQVSVICLRGHVHLSLRGTQIGLEPGQQLSYNRRGQGEPTTFDASEVLAWQHQMLVFNNATLAKVIDEINRYRPGRIVLLNRSLGQRRVQARFSFAQLAEVGELIRAAYGATVTELPGGVLLIS